MRRLLQLFLLTLSFLPIACSQPRAGNFEKELRSSLGGTWQVAYCRVYSEKAEQLFLLIASHAGPDANYLFSVKRLSLKHPYEIVIDSTPALHQFSFTGLNAPPDRLFEADTPETVRDFLRAKIAELDKSCQILLPSPKPQDLGTE